MTDIGINLAPVTYYSTEQPFLDRMKTSGTWTAVSDSGRAAPTTDANGYPIATSTQVYWYQTLVALDPISAGNDTNYVLEYNGDADFKLDGATIISQQPGKIVFNYQGAGQALLSMLPKGNNVLPSNISLVREDQLNAFQQGEIFNPAFISLVSKFSDIRFMDWMNTNQNTNINWSDRTTLSSVSWAANGATSSVPLEAMVALANESNKNMWFNVPTEASNDYVTSALTYIRDNLKPNLKVQIEYSNEVWNNGFSQNQYASEAAAKLWGANVYDPAEQYYGYRSAQIASIANNIFASSAGSRVENVLSPQTGYAGRETSIVAGVARAGLGTVSSLFQDYAVTTYFGGELGGGTAQDQATILSWANSGPQGLDAAFHELSVGGLLSSDQSLKTILGWLTYQKAFADANGLKLVGYEGGFEGVVFPFATADQPTVLAFFQKLVADPRMGTLYSDMIAGFNAAGGSSLNAFDDVGTPTVFGLWGALDSVYQTSSPRFDALTATATSGGASSTVTTASTSTTGTGQTTVTTPVTTGTSTTTTTPIGSSTGTTTGTGQTPVTTPVTTGTSTTTTTPIGSSTGTTTGTGQTTVTTPVTTGTSTTTTTPIGSSTGTTTGTGQTTVTTPVTTGTSTTTTTPIGSSTGTTTGTGQTTVTTPVTAGTSTTTTTPIGSSTGTTTGTGQTTVTTPVTTGTSTTTTTPIGSSTGTTTGTGQTTATTGTGIVTDNPTSTSTASATVITPIPVTQVVLPTALMAGQTDQTTYTLGASETSIAYVGLSVFTAVGNNLGNTITAGNGGSNLTGGTGNDTLIGGTGNDWLDGTSGADTLIGGGGNDTFVVSDYRAQVIETAGSGSATVRTSLGVYTMPDAITNLTFTGSGMFQAMGNALDNVITGGAGSNRLSGGAGNDTLIGGVGDDILDGGIGADTMIGGAGNDIYFVDNPGDQVIEQPGGGTDTVYSSIDYTLPDNVENLTLLPGATKATGNALDNVITANSGKDTLTGGAGADRFVFRVGTLPADPTQASTITDFSRAEGDKIDLSAMETQVSGGGSFTFIGTAAFGKHAGELRIDTSGANQVVYGDLNGDGIADFTLNVSKGSGALINTDFVL